MNKIYLSNYLINLIDLKNICRLLSVNNNFSSYYCKNNKEMTQDLCKIVNNKLCLGNISLGHKCYLSLSNIAVPHKS